MTNKLGTVQSGRFGKYIFPDGKFLVDLPENLQEVPDGWLVYLDREGRLQVMDEDPHDYFSREEA